MHELEGRRYVITGANTGVGRATAEALAARGARVVLACRSVERGRAAAANIDRAEVVHLDLADLDSVRRAADVLGREPIDALINNAAVAGARGTTRQGFELAFGVNHLGPYLLTRLLLERCARVVHLTSGSHATAARPRFERLRRRTPSLLGIPEYATSKLCALVFHHELARRLRGTPTVTVAADPGAVASDAFRHVPWPIRIWITRGMKPPREGARTSVFCATAPSLESGTCFVDERPFTPSALSRDEALARELWDRSAEWTGLAP
jgi:NAD(P)-dependent dehydrogenase (short-subunit alcohol dehydrogenase family)